MAVYKCAADGCYNQVDERDEWCVEHSIAGDVSPEGYAKLASVLSGAELRDWIGVEVLGNGVREWARKIDKPHQNVSRHLRSTREKLEDHEPR